LGKILTLRQDAKLSALSGILSQDGRYFFGLSSSDESPQGAGLPRSLFFVRK
jgi:hypothetical protein